MPGKRITVKDNRLRSFIKRIRTLKGLEVTVGVQGKEAEADHPESDGVPMRVIAAVHELGLGHVPKRSFLRDTYDKHRNRYIHHAVTEARRVAVTGVGTAAGVMFETGEMIRSDIIARMRSGIPPKLKNPSARRGGESAVPLIDKGHLMGSISSVLHIGGRKK